ncbi:MAG: hypothetical protein RR212_05820 [Bacteroidales bacterium]
MKHDLITEVDKRIFLSRGKTVTLMNYSTSDCSSEFWRVNVESKTSRMSMAFDNESLARIVFLSHVKF